MAANYPFQNTDLSLSERMEDLIGRLTLEEKAGFVSAKQIGVERLGIGEFNIGCEIARGYVGRTPEEPSTVLPQPIGMAAMFNPDLMYQLGELAGNETRVYSKNENMGRLMLFGPTVDMERDPRWGRTEEAYGEDPYLTGRMSTEFTKGLKGEDPFYLRSVPGLKHFCSNNNEKDRGRCSANLEPRTKHEYYYKAFRPSVTEGGAMSVMTAYNEISGVPALLNPDLKTILKEQWGLGYVVSDGADFVANVNDHHYVDNHVESIALAIKAGADVMLDQADVVQWSVLEAIKKGLLSEAELDESIKRTLSIRCRLGEFDAEADKNPYANLPASLVNCSKYKELNKQAAREQVILLKNDGILPLKKEKTKKLAIIGPLADKNYMDWYTGYSDYNITVLQCLKELMGEDKITYDNAYDYIAIKSRATGNYLSVKEGEEVVADSKDIGTAETFEYHDWDFGSQNLLSLKNHKFIKEGQEIKAAGINTYEWFVREWLKIKNYSDSTEQEGALLIDTWNNLHVRTDEKGKLTTSNDLQISESRKFTKETLSSGIARAVKLAEESEYAIVCVGNDPLQVAREGYDRPDLVLPKHQSDLIKAVHSVNPNTIVIIISSYPYAVNWEQKNIPAMLYTSHAGPELGQAIADVLLGAYNPAGRTPLTWYKSVQELPDIMDYDIIKNDMTYLYYKETPLYPFGYGLSYSTFRYTQLKIETITKDDSCKNTPFLKVKVSIMNTSEHGGDEVVQLYFRKENPRVKRPIRQLCGFQRIHIEPKEEVQVEFIIKESDLEYYDVTREKFCVEAGEYTFMVGPNCMDAAIRETLWIEGEVIPPQSLRKLTTTINYEDKSGVEMHYSKERGKHYLLAKGMSRHILKYGTVDMAGASGIKLIAATSIGKAGLSLYLDSPFGEALVTLEIPVTGGATHFTEVLGEFPPTEGIHDLYLVLESGVSLLEFLIR